MAKAAKMCQRVCKTRNIYKTNDKELFCLTYKEQIQNINDQIFKKQEKMVSLVKEMEVKIPRNIVLHPVDWQTLNSTHTHSL